MKRDKVKIFQLTPLKEEEDKFVGVRYRPQDLVLRGGEYANSSLDKYADKGCTFVQRKGILDKEEVEKKKENVEKCWTVTIVWPEGYTERYVNPLPRIHGEFWNKLSEQLREIYPCKSKNGRLSNRQLDLRSDIHLVIAYWYWEDAVDEWKGCDKPSAWLELLNRVLEIVATNRIKMRSDWFVKEDLKALREDLRKLLTF